MMTIIYNVIKVIKQFGSVINAMDSHSSLIIKYYMDALRIVVFSKSGYYLHTFVADFICAALRGC